LSAFSSVKFYDFWQAAYWSRHEGHTFVFTLCLTCMFLALASHFFIYCNIYWMLINIGSVQTINKQTNNKVSPPERPDCPQFLLSEKSLCDQVVNYYFPNLNQHFVRETELKLIAHLLTYLHMRLFRVTQPRCRVLCVT